MILTARAAMKKWAKPGRSVHIGSYEYVRGERQFVLTHLLTNKRVVFESWQAAKTMGWKHV